MPWGNGSRGAKKITGIILFILSMEGILHHPGWIKPCRFSSGINYLSTGAGFLPSTVCGKNQLRLVDYPLFGEVL